MIWNWQHWCYKQWLQSFQILVFHYIFWTRLLHNEQTEIEWSIKWRKTKDEEASCDFRRQNHVKRSERFHEIGLEDRELKHLLQISIEIRTVEKNCLPPVLCCISENVMENILQNIQVCMIINLSRCCIYFYFWHIYTITCTL